ETWPRTDGRPDKVVVLGSDTVVAKMVQHPAKVHRLGLRRDAVKSARLSACRSQCGAHRPSPVPGAELDHHIAVGGRFDGFENVNPLEVLIVEFRVPGSHQLRDSSALSVPRHSGLA